jgi:integrase
MTLFTQTEQELEDKVYSNFMDSLKSSKTKDVYDKALKLFMKFHKIPSYSMLLANVDIEEKIKQYIMNIRSRELSSSFTNVFFSSIKAFYEINDIENIRWHKLKRFVGEKTPKHEDRCYSDKEILTLLNASNLKQKVVILLMCSAGLRVGALPTLLLKHLTKMGDVYKIDVYKGLKGKGQYYTFCSPEYVTAIATYLSYRERCGEKITGDSQLLRKDFDSDFHESARNKVYPVTQHSIGMSIYHLLVKTGIRTIDHTNSRNRKEVKMTHGMRKFYVGQLVNSNLHETIIRKLSGHSDSSNLTQLYSKQTVEEMLTFFMTAIDNLTINPENRLKRKVEMLTIEKSKVDQALADIQDMKTRLGLT